MCFAPPLSPIPTVEYCQLADLVFQFWRKVYIVDSTPISKIIVLKKSSIIRFLHPVKNEEIDICSSKDLQQKLWEVEKIGFNYGFMCIGKKQVRNWIEVKKLYKFSLVFIIL